nr:unnamed protein product [Digitaria exilis]
MKAHQKVELDEYKTVSRVASQKTQGPEKNQKKTSDEKARGRMAPQKKVPMQETPQEKEPTEKQHPVKNDEHEPIPSFGNRNLLHGHLYHNDRNEDHQHDLYHQTKVTGKKTPQQEKHHIRIRMRKTDVEPDIRIIVGYECGSKIYPHPLSPIKRARARPAAPPDNLTFFSTRVMLSFPHQSTMEISRLEFAPRPSSVPARAMPSSWLRRARSGTRSRVPVPPFSATVCLPPPPVATAKKTVVRPSPIQGQAHDAKASGVRTDSCRSYFRLLPLQICNPMGDPSAQYRNQER